jgi:hypothetical protein
MDDERSAEPVVERVEMPDGRYLLYFSWPDEPAPTQPPEPPSGGVDE